MGLLPSTSGSMQSQVFTQMSGEMPQVLTPIPNPTRMCSTQSSGEDTTPREKAPGKKIKTTAKRRKKGQSGQPSEKKQIGLQKDINRGGSAPPGAQGPPL